MPVETWTQRDIELLESLSLRVRVMSLQQIARAWWGHTGHAEANARRRLATYIAADLIVPYQMPVHSLLPMTKPVVAWRPGSENPDPRKVSAHLKSRWTEPYQPATLYVASQKSLNLFGSHGNDNLDPLQANHDYHLSEVYLQYRTERPDEAADWLGEDAFHKAGPHIKDPDAFICDGDFQPLLVIEFGGKYDPRRVDEFHQHCEERELPYELW